jgi:hypothetical protein
MAPTEAVRRVDRAATPHWPLLGKLYVQALIAIAVGILVGEVAPQTGIARLRLRRLRSGRHIGPRET